MTKFEEITKDTETLARFLTYINNGECACCLAKGECDKLKQLGTYRLCTRSWCAWLNREVNNDA